MGSVANWKWTGAKLEAARMLAEDEMSNAKIAAKLDINPRTIWEWSQHEEFQAKIKQLLAAWEARIMKRGIANKARRVDFLNSLHDKHKGIIEARSKKNAKLTGGDTGLIINEKKLHGFGEDAVEIDYETFDTGFHREVRATLTQAAEETGQLTSKHELTGANGGPLEVNVGVLDDTIDRVAAARRKDEEDRARAAGIGGVSSATSEPGE